MELFELMERIKADDMSYFDELYNKTKKQVYYFIYSMVNNSLDSEDLLQETYLKLLRYKNRVKCDKVMVYLLQIAKTLTYNYLKRSKKVEIVESIDCEDEHQVYDLNKSPLIEQMKKILNDVELQIVILHVVDDMTHKEISKILKKPLGSITWAYNNAIKKLRREMNV